MKRNTCIIFYLLVTNIIVAQMQLLDSLKQSARDTRNDTLRLIWFRNIARTNAEINPDSSYKYSEQALALARQLHLKLDEGGAIREMGYAFLNQGNYPRALQAHLSSLAILEEPKSEEKVLVGNFPGDDALMFRSASPHAQRLSEIGFTHQTLGILYANNNNYLKSWYHHLLARKYANECGNKPLQSIVNLTFNRVYLNLKKTDSALLSIQLAYEQTMQSGYKRYLGSVLLNMGRTYTALKDTAKANEYYRKSLVASAEQGYFRGVVASNLLLADYYIQSGNRDSSYRFIKDALSAAQNLDAPDLLLRCYTSLTHYYNAAGNNDSTVKYQALIIKINESLFNAKQAQQFQNIDFDAQQRREEILATQKEYQNRMQKYFLLSGLAVVVIVALILFRNNKQKQKTNKVLQETLSELRSTQNQLIQSEKMASLGELTAGIAHEIQNPLNFVNNFSDINTELVTDATQEIEKGNIIEVKSILNDIKENEEKINHHGKRADAIVKNMLQHSRTGSGAKEPVDLNALVAEYLRLAYHGMRAKDKTFNAITKTDFNNNIGKINVNPQDLGRVILNLINNAFYAVKEKGRQNIPGYDPNVIISTERKDGKVEIVIRDNGNGIPPKLLDKIFQPFFTTKPTGEGTGLGLSLAYDIITKGHGGELKVKTIENEGAEFIIVLPIQNN